MDFCDKPIETYISVKEHEKLLARELTSQFDRLEKQFIDNVNELTYRFARADNFIKIVSSRIKEAAKGKKSLPLADIASLLPENKVSVEAARTIDKIIQMGLDFEILLTTMKNDELLTNQWKSIMMTMRLAGYDDFDRGDN